MSDAAFIGIPLQRRVFLRAAPEAAAGIALRPDAGGAAGAPASSLRRTQQTFGEALSIAGRSLDQGASNDTAAQARDAAAQFVAQVLVQPLMKQMRSSSWAAAPFAPSRMEQQFRSMLDSTVAIETVRAGNWPLVDRLAADMVRRGRAATDAVETPEGEGPRFFDLNPPSAGLAPLLEQDGLANRNGTPLADPGLFAAPGLALSR